jgi:hypothetical protein
MNSMKVTLVALALLVFAGQPAQAQVYKYYSPGSVWVIQFAKIRYQQDQNYLAYLDGTFKKLQDAQVKAGIIKSYKVLRTLDDDQATWNIMLMCEYPSLAAFEASRQREDSIETQVFGTETARATTAEERLKMRDPAGTRMLRELILK